MSESTLKLLLESKIEQEKNARLELEAANIELQNYYQQLELIENYRLDYSRQLNQRGLQGLTANEYMHLQRFLVKMDETLLKQKSAEYIFKNKVNEKTNAWHEKRREKRSLEYLIEKKEKERAKLAAHKEQLLMDEFATLNYTRKKLRHK